MFGELIDGDAVDQHLTGNGATGTARFGSSVGMTAELPTTFNELAHDLGAVKDEYRPKILDAHAQTDPDFSHFHVGITFGFVVVNDAVAAAKTGDQDIDIFIVKHRVTRTCGNLGDLPNSSSER